MAPVDEVQKEPAEQEPATKEPAKESAKEPAKKQTLEGLLTMSQR